MTYREVRQGFTLVPPTYGDTYGKSRAFSKHFDGRVLYEEFASTGIVRARIEDSEGNAIGTWRERNGQMVECSWEEYTWGWFPRYSRHRR